MHVTTTKYYQLLKARVSVREVCICKNMRIETMLERYESDIVSNIGGVLTMCMYITRTNGADGENDQKKLEREREERCGE